MRIKVNIPRFLLFLATVFIIVKIVGFLINGLFSTDKKELSFFSDFEKKKDSKIMNVLVLGVDKEEIRTDVILVASINTKDKTLKLLSVPRDTEIDLEDNVVENMENKSHLPKNHIVKLTEVHSYAGKEHAVAFTKYEIERLLGIKIDKYVKVNIKAFRNVVNAVDGVDINVPRNMRYYDPTQNLNINLNKGMQHLNGEKAEQLVRFRHYVNGDLDRIQIQQMFLKELAKKVLDNADNVNVLIGIAKNIFGYVETDINITEIPKFVNYAKNIKVDEITMETVPGTPGIKINNADYYHVDSESAKKAAKRLYENLDYTSKNIKVVLENGTNDFMTGIAHRDLLEKYGFKVEKYTNNPSEKNIKTKIYLYGKDNLKYYKSFYTNPEIVQIDSNEEYDVKIILGSNETR